MQTSIQTAKSSQVYLVVIVLNTRMNKVSSYLNVVLCGYIPLIVLNIATQMDNSHTNSVGLVTLDFFGEAVAFHCL